MICEYPNCQRLTTHALCEQHRKHAAQFPDESTRGSRELQPAAPDNRCPTAAVTNRNKLLDRGADRLSQPVAWRPASLSICKFLGFWI